MFLFVWWCVRWSLAIVLFVAVMLGAGYYVYHEALTGGKHVEVPDVTMRPVTEASYLLAENGLELGPQKQVPDDRVPKYYVIAQRPASGKVIRVGRKVSVTVSAGSESLSPPDLTGQTLENAQTELRRSAFELGTVPRIAHSSPRDTVLAQDPVPSRLVSSGTRINLLVSDGMPKRAFIMPDLLGKPVQEVMRVLSPKGVNPIPRTVDMPGQRTDVVLDQQPPAGTLIQEGDSVVYTVYPSGFVPLPDAQHRTERFTYVVPDSWFEREVRVDTVDRHGTHSTYFPLQHHYVNGQAPRFPSGTPFTIGPFSYIDKMSVEIYLDGHPARSYYYEDGRPPTVTDHSVQ
ncbi:MAG: PASTA domain-containing protein [Nitrospiraceae bacterium]|nr:PASTA domain-containing protein [Nitrospiraceae bacterium]